MKSVKNLSVFVAEQNEKWSEKKVVFCSYRCILESEKLKCERKFCKRVKFFVHVWHFKAVFFSIFWQKGLVMIFFKFQAVYGSGLKVSGNLFEFYANSVVFHVF